MKTAICIIFTLIGIESFSQTELIFYTNYGQFVVVMEDSLTPITSGNFIKLADEKYYDGVLFHRVIDGFMIQGGDPNGDGTGGPGYSIPDEFHVSLSNVQGTISMANTGPNTGGSQFFINLVNNTYLDFNKPPFTSKHAVFGHVVQGFEVVQAIGKVQTDNADRPVEEVRMDSVRVIRAPAKDQDMLPAMTLFPNPVQVGAQLTFEAPDSGTITLRCYDVCGSQVWQMQVEVYPGIQTIPLMDLYNNLPHRGLYFLSIEDRKCLRFVKTE